MSIKRFNQFPENSGAISSDDIFLFMDNPSGQSTTKKISLSELSSAIGVSSSYADTGDITFSGSVISTLNTDQDIVLNPNGSGDVVIGTNKNLVFDINAFTGQGIKIIDSTEDGYDDPETPSVLKVGSIYHSVGNMVIQSDGAIYPSEDPSAEISTYGGLVITNKDNSAGIYIASPTGTISEIPSGTVTINGSLRFNNNTTIAQGTFDNSTGGNNGISLNCVVGYELNWQGGHLKSTYNNGETTANIWCDSGLEFPGSGTDNMEINSSGLIFPNNTVQTSAGIPSNTGVVPNSTSITNIVAISQADYDSIVTKDPTTLYIVS